MNNCGKERRPSVCVCKRSTEWMIDPPSLAIDPIERMCVYSTFLSLLPSPSQLFGFRPFGSANGAVIKEGNERTMIDTVRSWTNKRA